MLGKAFNAVLFLAAIVAANLVITKYGQSAVLYVGASFVAFVFVMRDRLHDSFETHRVPKMAALILSGAAISYLMNADAEKIAVASGAAFLVGETLDWITYHSLRRREWLERSNVSNVVGAIADTIVFMALAFDTVPVALAFGQASCKIAGGFILSLALRRRREAHGRRFDDPVREGA